MASLFVSHKLNSISFSLRKRVFFSNPAAMSFPFLDHRREQYKTVVKNEWQVKFKKKKNMSHYGILDKAARLFFSFALLEFLRGSTFRTSKLF